MTCAHVLDLIDAGPFAGYSNAHMREAWDHARHCATCGPARQMATRIASDLAGLAEPAPTVDMADGVLARIQRIEQARRGAGVPVRAAVPAGVMPAVAIVGGVALVLSIQPGQVPWSDLIAEPDAAGAVILVAGLILYAAGLLAPLASASDEEAR